MSDEQWFAFFSACARVLGPGQNRPTEDGSWCAWTTFASLQEEVHYWSAGVPLESELHPKGTHDGGTWGQPFHFQDLAHVLVPRKVHWEIVGPTEFRRGSKLQDIEQLSCELAVAKVPHRVTELILEVKLY